MRLESRLRFMASWPSESVCDRDQLNSGIWSCSPAVQHSIQSPERLTPLGSIGDQQAMLPN